jgi:hypothetical protein
MMRRRACGRLDSPRSEAMSLGVGGVRSGEEEGKLSYVSAENDRVTSVDLGFPLLFYQWTSSRGNL